MTIVGALRRRLLTPDVSETTMRKRGFHVKDAEAVQMLETVGRMFLAGYGAAAEAGHPEGAEPALDQVPRRYRGFAYEGAAMCLAVRDALSIRGGRVAQFLAGPGDRHVYMSYVGVGWAMARLPRIRWRSLYAPDPVLRWLILDGYGFHQVYFHTDQYAGQRVVDDSCPWAGEDPSRYRLRAIDQGIGRGMWFVGGTDVGTVADLIDAFDESRRADLYAGAGLAATYAGGAGERELVELAGRAGCHRPHLAQGAAFGAAARVRANLVVPHTELAAKVLCGMSATEAAATAELARPAPRDEPDKPAYELWRERIRAEFSDAETP